MNDMNNPDNRIATLQELCAAAYQALGAADGPVEMLDNLSDAANGRRLRHEPCAGLPWVPEHLANGYILVSKEWEPIMVEVHRRADKECGEECDFTVRVAAEEYCAILAAEKSKWSSK